MIYTSYFAKLRALPSVYVPIAICRSVPKGYNGLRYLPLAPSSSVLYEYKRFNDRGLYAKRFNQEALERLDPDEVVRELNELAGGRGPIVLVCYERSDSFCHRQLVSDWLTSNGYMSREL